RRQEKLQERAEEERRHQETETKRRLDEAEAEKRRQDEDERRRRHEAERNRQLIEGHAASAPKSTVRPTLFARGPVIGSIAAAVAVVFLLTYLIWSRSQQLAPTISDSTSVQPSALTNTNAPSSVPPAAARAPVQQAVPPADPLQEELQRRADEARKKLEGREGVPPGPFLRPQHALSCGRLLEKTREGDCGAGADSGSGGRRARGGISTPKTRGMP